MLFNAPFQQFILGWVKKDYDVVKEKLSGKPQTKYQSLYVGVCVSRHVTKAPFDSV